MLPRPRLQDAIAGDAELLSDAEVVECADRAAPIPPPVPWAAGTKTGPVRPERGHAVPESKESVADVYDRHAPFVFRVLRGQ